MELVYTASAPPNQRKDWVRDEWPLCTLSPRNIMAFTSNQILVENERAQPDAPYHVYVCDIDKPWDIYLITQSTDNIIWLDWDASGTKIIMASAVGHIQIWVMKDYLLDNWTCSHSTAIEGEEIVAVSWLHTGVRMNFLADHKDNVLYSDKISRAKFLPSLSHFGGKPTQGFITLTASGMIFVGLLKANTSEIATKSESLAACRNRLMIADITHEPCGKILVATSDGNIGSAIQCFRVVLKPEHGLCSISSKPVASLYAKCHMDKMLRDSQTSRVTHIKFMPTENGQVLIIGAGDMDTSHVELWNLTDQIVSLHQFYQSGASLDSSYSTHKWIHKSSITHGSLPISIAVPRFPVVYGMSDVNTGLFQYVAISYKDGSVKLINRSNFQPMSTTNLDIGISENGEKRRKTVPYMVYMQQTFTGCGLVGVDQYSCQYVMRAVNTRDPLTMTPPVYLVALLEYAIILGYDWWDVVASLKPGLIEDVIQKLSDNYVKQPSAMQDLLYARFMAVKASLYCSSTAGQQRAADCHCQIMLHSLATAFKSMLRPKAISLQEMSPAEKLTHICIKNYETDIDKVMVTLNSDHKEFFVDPPTLQALQQLIQWVTDLTLYLLASLPMLQNYNNFPGAVLVHDAGALSMLRELLLLIRIWGLINQSCSPHFTNISTNDCLAQLFKLLTKVWLIRKEGGSIECDEGLLDECCLLPSQVMIPPIDQGLFGDTNYESSIFFQSQPLKYIFSETPAHANRKNSSLVLPVGQFQSQQKKDIVRQVSLGTHPVEELRQCSRCSCVSLINSISKVPAVRAWDLRWAKACPCGGHWKGLKRSPNANNQTTQV